MRKRAREEIRENTQRSRSVDNFLQKKKVKVTIMRLDNLKVATDAKKKRISKIHFFHVNHKMKDFRMLDILRYYAILRLPQSKQGNPYTHIKGKFQASTNQPTLTKVYSKFLNFPFSINQYLNLSIGPQSLLYSTFFIIHESVNHLGLSQQPIWDVY